MGSRPSANRLVPAGRNVPRSWNFPRGCWCGRGGAGSDCPIRSARQYPDCVDGADRTVSVHDHYLVGECAHVCDVDDMGGELPFAFEPRECFHAPTAERYLKLVGPGEDAQAFRPARERVPPAKHGDDGFCGMRLAFCLEGGDGARAPRLEERRDHGGRQDHLTGRSRPGGALAWSAGFPARTSGLRM